MRCSLVQDRYRRRGREVMPMLTHEYVVRYADGLWRVRLDGRLVSAESNRMDALYIADALAHAGGARGERSKILVLMAIARRSNIGRGSRARPRRRRHRKKPRSGAQGYGVATGEHCTRRHSNDAASARCSGNKKPRRSGRKALAIGRGSIAGG